MHDYNEHIMAGPDIIPYKHPPPPTPATPFPPPPPTHTHPKKKKSKGQKHTVPSAKAEMTFPNADSDLLMFLASSRTAPSAPVLLTCNEEMNIGFTGSVVSSYSQMNIVQLQQFRYHFIHVLGSCSGLMVSVLDSRLSGQSLSPGWGTALCPCVLVLVSLFI